MRPEEISRNINLAFKRFSRRGNLHHFAKCKRHLQKRLAWFEARGDVVSEIYQEGDVVGHIEYISDRWNCADRVRFLLRVIEEGR